jgi:phosphoribosylformimino-5-aminoimidazole carboxamide ribonucleotide (ProFAR) isomerase
MFERHHQPLLPMRQFVARVARGVGIAVGIDAKGGKVAVEGWAETSELGAVREQDGGRVA